MQYLTSALVIAVGGLMLFKPDFFWQIEVTCAVKSGESSRGYRILMRILGAVCVILPILTLLLKGR